MSSRSRYSTVITLFIGVVFLALPASQTFSQVVVPAPYDTARVMVRSIGVGPQVGYYSSSDANSGAFYVGISGRFKFANVFAAEATLGYRGKQTFDFVRVQGTDLSARTSTIPLTVSLMLYVAMNQPYVPYLIGGGGLYFLTIDYSPGINVFLGDETKVRGGAHIGAGVEFPLSQYLSLTADYRYLFLGNIFSGGGGYDFSRNSYNGGSFTGSMFIYF